MIAAALLGLAVGCVASDASDDGDTTAASDTTDASAGATITASGASASATAGDTEGSATDPSATTDPSTTDSATTDPSTTDSATTDSATTDSATTDSATTDSATTDSATTDSATTDSDTEPDSGTGLDFPPNGMPGSDARLVWDGPDMLPRASHTAIWQARYVQQNGYYAVAWHTSNDGTWHASPFEYGTHPYPTSGTVDATGQSTGGTGSEGMVQYYEIAGLGASDFIASPGPGPTYPLVPDIWVTQARTAEVVGDQVRHRYWPDLNDPDAFIEQSFSAAGIEQAAAVSVSPAFTLGGSPWTGDGVSNGESPASVLRGIALFDAPLDIDDLVAEATSESDAPVTAAGTDAVWYINRNPTPDDIGDKSGAGHSPTWANDQRPDLYVVP